MMGNAEELGVDLPRKRPVKYYLLGIAPVIVLILLSLPFLGFISRIVASNPLLNGKILGVMLLGVFIVMQRIYLVQKEYAVLDRFMEALDSGEPMADLLNDASVRDSRVGHVMENLVETEGRISSQIVQTSLIKDVDHLQHSFQSSYDIPNFVVGFMISLGLLGTFIGLLDTLLGLSDMLGSIQTQASGDLSKAVLGLIGKLQAPLAGMGTAFAASLFGLVGSSLLAIMMLSLKYSVAQFMHAMRRYLAAVVEHEGDHGVADAAAVKLPEALTSPGQLSDSFLKELTAQMVEQYAMSQEIFRQSEKNLISAVVRIDTLTDRISQLAELTRAHVELNSKMHELLGYGPRMRDLSEQTLAQMKSMTEGQHRQDEGLGNVAQAIGSLDSILVHITAQLGEIATRLDRSHTDQSMLAAMQRIHADAGDMRMECNQGVQVAIDIARHLAEANAMLKDIRQSHEPLAKMQESSAQQSVLTEMLLDELRNTRNTIVRDLRAELRELSRSMHERGTDAVFSPNSP